MKRYLIIIVALVATLFAQAQKPREVLDKTAELIRSYGALEVAFTASAYIDADDDEVMRGTMSLDGRKFRLQSNALKIWYDGKTEWSYNVQSGEVYVTNPTASEMAIVNPMSFINSYKEGYKLSLKKSKFSGKDTYEVTLKATSKKSVADEVKLQIARDNYGLLNIIITQDGQQSNITINGVKGQQKFAQNYFTFNAKQAPGAEVVDLR